MSSSSEWSPRRFAKFSVVIKVITIEWWPQSWFSHRMCFFVFVTLLCVDVRCDRVLGRCGSKLQFSFEQRKGSRAVEDHAGT